MQIVLNTAVVRTMIDFLSHNALRLFGKHELCVLASEVMSSVNSTLKTYDSVCSSRLIMFLGICFLISGHRQAQLFPGSQCIHRGGFI